jgi:hypothetical protein
MGLRKRFLVAVVGVPGSPAEAQRSEVGRFRNLGAAEEAGRDEWKRILFVHAPHVERYRIVVEDDGVEVADVPMPELPADAAPGILDETVTPLGASVGALGEPIDPDAAGAADATDEADATADQDAADEPVVAEAVDEPAVAATPDAADADAAAAGPASPPEEIQATGEIAVVEDERDDLAATGEHKGTMPRAKMTVATATGHRPRHGHPWKSRTRPTAPCPTTSSNASPRWWRPRSSAPLSDRPATVTTGADPAGRDRGLKTEMPATRMGCNPGACRAPSRDGDP